MFIDNIILSNFRNFNLLNIKTEKINVIYGKNASGKTNVIEGIYIILNGHSFKNKNTPLQKDLSQKTIIAGTIDSLNSVYIEINKGKKTIKFNTKKTTVVNLKINFPSVLYSIDSFISFKDKNYLFSLIDKSGFVENNKILNILLEYNKLIKIKKEALTIKDEGIDFLRLINKKIKENMDFIRKHRIKTLKLLTQKTNVFLSNFTDKKIDMEYTPKLFSDGAVLEELKQKRSVISLNRDKITILLDNKDIFTYSSVGEKKIVLLSIILSVVNIYNKYKQPVLLIDDLEGDLDENAKKISFDLIKNLPNQLFLTTLGEYLYNGANIIRL